MAFVKEPNTCGLFDNTRNPNKFDLTGSIELVCPNCGTQSPWYVDGWRRTAKSGLAYISLALKPKANRPATAQPPNNRRARREILNALSLPTRRMFLRRVVRATTRVPVAARPPARLRPRPLRTA